MTRTVTIIAGLTILNAPNTQTLIFEKPIKIGTNAEANQDSYQRVMPMSHPASSSPCNRGVCVRSHRSLMPKKSKSKKSFAAGQSSCVDDETRMSATRKSFERSESFKLKYDNVIKKLKAHWSDKSFQEKVCNVLIYLNKLTTDQIMSLTSTPSTEESGFECNAQAILESVIENNLETIYDTIMKTTKTFSRSISDKYLRARGEGSSSDGQHQSYEWDTTHTED